MVIYSGVAGIQSILFSFFQCKFYSKKLIFFVFIIIPGFLQAQQLSAERIVKNDSVYAKDEAYIIPEQLFDVFPEFNFSSIVFKIPKRFSFDELFMIIGHDTIKIRENEHYRDLDDYRISDLIVFDSLIKDFKFYSGNIQGKVFISYFNGLTDHVYNIRKKNEFKKFCEKPVAIDQADWRYGLPEPGYKRIENKVEHVIIHHSATSNALNNYTNLVRNIYLFHTQENGWSDIGYNYLIAPDGTLFKGRDPGSSLVEQDNVLGAHFCGSNSGTMGVCMLGTYTKYSPTDSSVDKLIELLAWKMEKEELDPFSSFFHPLNPRLPVIAGHRDGCATECPGQQVYERLGSFRILTEESIENCRLSNEEQSVKLYYDLNNMQVKITTGGKKIFFFKVYDVRGQQINITGIIKDRDQIIIPTEQLANGLYILNMEVENRLLKRKFIVYH